MTPSSSRGLTSPTKSCRGQPTSRVRQQRQHQQPPPPQQRHQPVGHPSKSDCQQRAGCRPACPAPAGRSRCRRSGARAGRPPRPASRAGGSGTARCPGRRWPRTRRSRAGPPASSSPGRRSGPAVCTWLQGWPKTQRAGGKKRLSVLRVTGVHTGSECIAAKLCEPGVCWTLGAPHRDVQRVDQPLRVAAERLVGLGHVGFGRDQPGDVGRLEGPAVPAAGRAGWAGVPAELEPVHV